MKVIHDKGKRLGIYRFLKFSSKKQIDKKDEDVIFILLGILSLSIIYSFRHKCWIFKY